MNFSKGQCLIPGKVALNQNNTTKVSVPQPITYAKEIKINGIVYKVRMVEETVQAAVEGHLDLRRMLSLMLLKL